MRPERAARGEWRWPLVFVGLALLYLWPLTLRPNDAAYPPGAPFTDLLINHVPNAEYIRDSLARYGQLPLWNAQLFAGQPFAADPLSGLWYVPNVLALLLPLPFGFNLLVALHLAWAGCGVYRWLRAEGLGAVPALLGGAAFAGTPKMIAHIGAGHVSLVPAVAWTPWLLWAVQRAARQGGVRRGALAGACLGAIFLADVRWSFYAGVLASGFWAAQAWAARAAPAVARARQPDSARVLNLAARPAAPSRGWLALGAALLAAALLSAVLAVPLAEFLPLSRRTALSLEEAALYSLPPYYLLGLILPDVRGFHEYMTYVGVVPLLLAPLGLRRGNWFWGAAAGIGVAFALGTYFVLFPLLFRVTPVLGWLRVPTRAWFFVALALSVLAAHGAQALGDRWWPLLSQRYGARGWRLPSARAVVAALLVFTVLDLIRVDGTLLDPRPRPPLVPAAAWLRAQPGLFRVYSPSYSLPMGDGLQHVDGVDPLQLDAAVDYIEQASGTRAEGYSVTVPAFPYGNLAEDNIDAKPVAELLGRLNVQYVAAEFYIIEPGFDLVQTFGRTRVYAVEAFRPRAWVQLNDGGEAAAEITRWSPNRIEVSAAGPGTLVLSEVAYPGWRARVDGQPAPLHTAEGVFRAVELPAGAHTVTFEFAPTSVYLGAALSLAGLAWLAVLAWRGRGPRT